MFVVEFKRPEVQWPFTPSERVHMVADERPVDGSNWDSAQRNAESLVPRFDMDHKGKRYEAQPLRLIERTERTIMAWG